MARLRVSLVVLALLAMSLGGAQFASAARCTQTSEAALEVYGGKTEVLRSIERQCLADTGSNVLWLFGAGTVLLSLGAGLRRRTSGR